MRRGVSQLAVIGLAFAALGLMFTAYAAISVTPNVTPTDFYNTSSTPTATPLAANDTLSEGNSNINSTRNLRTDRILNLDPYRTNTQPPSLGAPSGIIATVTQNLGLYSDNNCTVPLTNLDWGSPSPGTTVTRTFYVKNTLPSTQLTISMAATNWNPATANGPLSITWDRQGTVLTPGQSTEATITLAVSPSISIKSFSVQITFSGTA